jgi:hypothetical protein
VETEAARTSLVGLDALVCCSNTASSRTAVARYAADSHIPHVGAAVSDARETVTGRVLLHEPGSTLACEGCFQADAPGKQVGGVVLPMLAWMVAAIAVQRMIARFISAPAIADNVVLVNALDWSMETMTVLRRPDCSACGVGG